VLRNPETGQPNIAPGKVEKESKQDNMNVFIPQEVAPVRKWSKHGKKENNSPPEINGMPTGVENDESRYVSKNRLLATPGANNFADEEISPTEERIGPLWPENRLGNFGDGEGGVFDDAEGGVFESPRRTNSRGNRQGNFDDAEGGVFEHQRRTNSRGNRFGTWDDVEKGMLKNQKREKRIRGNPGIKRRNFYKRNRFGNWDDVEKAMLENQKRKKNIRENRGIFNTELLPLRNKPIETERGIFVSPQGRDYVGWEDGDGMRFERQGRKRLQGNRNQNFDYAEDEERNEKGYGNYGPQYEVNRSLKIKPRNKESKPKSTKSKRKGGYWKWVAE